MNDSTRCSPPISSSTPAISVSLNCRHAPSRPLLDMYIAAAHRHGSDGPLAHHVTNVIVREDGDGARAWSKGMALNQDGSVASVTYEDQLVRTRQGWRIRHRKISARRKAGHGVEPLSLPG
ncbi:nuclear transport factor 2 family protein [Streptomyces sp. NPDC005890]|uniref:nuclear transport factor 2 family protein n=1 Tax=Streptomyces sp. NPDC005890 TaxID=3154568 RepID=UPI0033EF30EE